MSKGSTRRPNFVPLAELAARWDATFPPDRTQFIPASDHPDAQRTRRFEEAERDAGRPHFLTDTVARTTIIETPTGGHGVIFDISDRTPIPSDPDERQA